MNQIANIATNLPAHLQHLAGKNTAMAAMGGITIGSSIHQISIKGSKWRLQDPQGGENIVPTHHVDLLIVDANPTLSKVFYLGVYNPADTDYKAPDCYSDNGVAPSARAAKPQSLTCAACPQNVWGSKVTPSGAQTRACGDSKKLAVILADNPTGPVYLLKIPAASLKNLYAFVESLTNRGIPLPAIVVRMEFDPASDYPKINFTPTGWATPEQSAAIQDIIGTDEVAGIIGLKDIARNPATPLPAPVAAAPAAPLNPLLAPAPVAAAPAMANAEPAAPAAAPRRRRTKAEIAAATQTAEPAVPAPAAPTNAAPAGGLNHTFAAYASAAQDIPNAAAPAAAVKVTPQPTTSALDDLINDALKL